MRGNKKTRLKGWVGPICLFAVGLALYLLGWLVVGEYLLVLLGFLISCYGIIAIGATIYEDMKKRPAYWNRLIKRSLPYLLVVSLVLSFLGYFLGRYVHEWCYALFVLGLIASLFFFGMVIFFLLEYIVKHIKRKYSL